MASVVKSSVKWLLKYMHYLLCLLVLVTALTSIGNFQLFVSKQSLSRWNQDSSVLARFLWDAALLVGFMCQHSLMAAPWFKDKLGSWLRVTVSQRLIYTAASSLALLFLIFQWQSIPETGLWVVSTQDRWSLWLLFLLLHVVAWFVWTLQVLLMDPGEMLGVTQVSCYYNGQPQPLTRGKSAQKLLDFYSRLRHPGTLLITAMLWVHPLMTLDRLLLACWFSCYLVWRHSLVDSHYTFAETHFATSFTTKKRSSSSVAYEYVEDW